MGTMTETETSYTSSGVGQPIPDTEHAVSVSLPTWRANVGYEEGEEWVVSKMKTGYPRFFVHLTIQSFAKAIISRHGRAGEEAMLFPSRRNAERCKEFIARKSGKQDGQTQKNLEPRILDLVLKEQNRHPGQPQVTAICAVILHASDLPLAQKFWQHTGAGVSSRRAELFRKAFDEGHLQIRNGTASDQAVLPAKGPKRYQRLDSSTSQSIQTTPKGQAQDVFGTMQFLEERFGRNLDMSLSKTAKLAIRKRIAGFVCADVGIVEAAAASDSAEAPLRKDSHVSVDDVYLYSCGMDAIFNSHQTLLKAHGPRRSIMFGFPYIDTLKILENWGPGCKFYGHSSSEELDDLESCLMSGERFLALYCEFPGNPLLRSPDLKRIRKLADQYGFAVVVDETIGNYLNVNVLPAADIVVSSLTKIFSGDSNVMGGSLVLNPRGQHYEQLTAVIREDYEDNYWGEDAVYMERNSRDFVSRSARVNKNSEMVCQLLKDSPLTKEVYYPKYSSSKSFYDNFKNPNGGYGGLFSITFHSREDAVAFFDALDTAKGPSLGTNFTLSCPFVLLAHYNELEWAGQFGAEADLVRVSTGLEDSNQLIAAFSKALKAVEDSRQSRT